jgi:hypothetical protein
MTRFLLAVLLAAPGPLLAADRAFDRVVRQIEAHYGVERVHIPLMGMANLFVKVGRPSGTSSFKLAMFDNLPERNDQSTLDKFMRSLSSSDLHPFVRAVNRHGEEATYILTGEVGKSTTMLIATFDRHNATVIEVKVNLDRLMQTLTDPSDACRSFRGNRKSDTE